jgi:hypothetical protein
MIKKMFTAAALLAFFLGSCYNDNREDLYPTPSQSNCDTTGITYTAVIEPLMRQSCAISACHDDATASLDIVLDNYEGVRTIAMNGKLMGSITHAGGFYPMPKDGNKLDDCTIAKIRSWVRDGAPE